MDFWRGPAYTAFFEFLDSKGGFYYEVTVFIIIIIIRLVIDISILSALGRCTCPLDGSCSFRFTR